MSKVFKTTLIIGAIILVLMIIKFGWLYNQHKIGNAPQNQNKEAILNKRLNATSPVASTATRTTLARLPLSGSAPINDVSHTIPLEEIKKGCFRQDCIPSVDKPQFVLTLEAKDILSADSLGIALSYKDEQRFYPFPMLETHELVNDVVAGDPLLISYCPLCGTGIVFDRVVDEQVMSFGVSGMLWQSNLLMYNRADILEERNLWSQVIGEAVVGNRAGEKLTVIPSDIVRFGEWANLHPNGQVLITGSPQDPYRGAYYETARFFEPSYTDTGLLPPETYIHGVIIGEQPVAFVKDNIHSKTYTIDDQEVQLVRNEENQVLFLDQTGSIIPDVEGFWFSWQAAHPDTIVITQ